jgi:penicillin amidase
MHVAGATIPGVPGVVAGRNDSIAWCSTVCHADAQDLFLEQLSAQFPGKYKSSSGWENTTEVREYIPVRFGNDYVHKVVSTKHGPIIFQDDKAATAVCLNWSGYDTREPVMKTIFALERVSNWEQFNKVLGTYSGAARTFLYVDDKGALGFHVAGNIPVRVGTGATLMPGWTGQGDWHGRVKYEELAHGFNPSQGYVVADSPDFGNPYSNNPLRAMRIGSVLSGFKKGNQRVGLPDMAQLQGDLTASFAPQVRQELEDAIKRTQLIDEVQISALDLLKQWDGQLKADSTAAAVYESFVTTLTRRVLEPKLGAQMTREYLDLWPRWSLFTQKILTSQPKEWLPPEERTYDSFFITTFSEALKNIKVACKSTDLNRCVWQVPHQIQWQAVFNCDSPVARALSPLINIQPVGVGGDQDCVNALNIAASVDPLKFTCDSGPTQRLLIDMADKDRFYQTLTLGQSEHLTSSYRQDQLKNWLTLRPHSIALSREQMEKQQQHKVVFTNR